MKARLRLFTMLAIASMALSLESCTKDKPSLSSQIPESQLWEVKAGSVYDGDSFRVIKENRELKIRMCGIDAPEKRQPFGIESRDYLRSLLSKDNDRVSVVVTDKDRYGRTVAEIFVSDGDKEIFVNGEMVRVGLAYEYKRYSGKCPNKDALDTAQKIAEVNKAGVWSNPNSVYPWDYRKNGRK